MNREGLKGQKVGDSRTPPGRRRNTRQREIILSTLREALGPLSIAELFERSRGQLPRLGLATVYRTVGLLQELGLVSEVHLPGREVRFEPSGRGHHHHFQCRVCKRIFEIQSCHVGLSLNHMLPSGFYVDEHELTLYGRCAMCA